MTLKYGGEKMVEHMERMFNKIVCEENMHKECQTFGLVQFIKEEIRD